MRIHKLPMRWRRWNFAPASLRLPRLPLLPRLRTAAMLGAVLLGVIAGQPLAGAAEIAQADLDGSLIRAAGTGDLRSFNLVLRLGANVRAVTRHGDNVVLAAVDGDQPALLRLVLDMGASPEVRGAAGFTPLTLATLRRSLPSVRALIKAGADVNRKSAVGDSPLHLAVSSGAPALLAEILAARPYLDALNALGETALLVAVQRDDRAAFDRLINAGADLDARDRGGRSALIWAILEDREAMAIALVQAGARHDGLLGTYTALHMARVKKQDALSTLLAARGARE